jgi:hypothetical protein
MEFKKCARCGIFFLSDSEVCPKCQPKDECEIAKVTNYINENDITNCSVAHLSINTGVSLKNLNRYLNTNVIPKINL